MLLLIFLAVRWSTAFACIASPVDENEVIAVRPPNEDQEGTPPSGNLELIQNRRGQLVLVSRNGEQVSRALVNAPPGSQPVPAMDAPGGKTYPPVVSLPNGMTVTLPSLTPTTYSSTAANPTGMVGMTPFVIRGGK
ncbi:hypothetical protein Q1695_007748 [Nippostrongylus brasiliensis]|nr:hypothetical protein Q1695_007748 [Nippostrongylus brasiliensis]